MQAAIASAASTAPTATAHLPRQMPLHLIGFHLKLSQQGMCTLCFTGLCLKNLQGVGCPHMAAQGKGVAGWLRRGRGSSPGMCGHRVAQHCNHKNWEATGGQQAASSHA
jgi:hypothetical protein